MAKDNIIDFPKKPKQSVKQKASMLQSRLEELSVESQYITEDIQYLTEALKKNEAEVNEIALQLSKISSGTPSKDVQALIDLITQWGEQLTPDKQKIVEDKADEVADVFVDIAKKLEETFKQLTLDLNINPDKEDK
jgi:seryl-tRNA synthetase